MAADRRTRLVALMATLTAALALFSCHASPETGGTSSTQPTAVSGLPPDLRPVKTGRAARYHPPALSAAVARRAAVMGLGCRRAHPRAYGAHVELYADRLVLPVPAGIGVAPPQTRRGVYVLGGPCTYPVRTFEPTGVVAIDAGRAPSLATLFALWGQPLSATRLAGFKGRVAAFVGGRRWAGPPGAIPLSRHGEIVLEVGGALPPHRAYRFPPGL